jgi:branched-chain amino acid transport system substrate-binding protein
MARRLAVCSVALMIVSLLAPLSSAFAGTPAWTPVETFLLGSINHMTGPTALSGELRKKGYELGVDEANAAKGVNGLPVKIVYEDDQGTNPGAVAAVRRLIAQQPVVAVLGERSTMVNAIHPIIMEEKVPTFFGASAWSISELKNPWFFRMRLDDKGGASVMAKFIVEELKKTKIAGLYAGDVFGEGGNKETSAYLKEKYNIVPVNTQKYASGTKDYTAQLLAIKASGAEVIFAWGTNAEDTAIYLRQFKQLGLGIDFMGSASHASTVSLELAGVNANGIYSIYDFAFEDPRPQLQAWLKAYRAKYKEDPDFWGQYNYDTVKLIAEAAGRAGIIRKDGNKFYQMPLPEARVALAKAIRETKGYAGAQGDYWCDEYQNMIHNQAVVRIESQKPKMVKIIKLK